jgi:hypothetical protein
VDALEEWIAEGKTLREFCRQDGNPCYSVIYKTINANPEIKQRIACARESGEDAIAEECFAIADDATNDWMERIDKDEKLIGWQLNGDHVQRSKLRIETRLKLLAKWNPRKFGDKLGLCGADGAGPVQIITSIPRPPEKLSK